MPPTTLFTSFLIAVLMKLFPYKTRSYQRNIIQHIEESLTTGTPLVLESGTGSGKTVCAVSSTLAYALKNNKKIVYTTRTNAQQKQVIEETREIKKRFPKETENVIAVGMQGRAHMCLLAKNNPELQKGSADELARLCAEEKKKVRRGKRKGCIYFRKCVENEEAAKHALEWMKNSLPTAEELVKYCEEHTLCPYEINKLLVQDALLVVVPYIYVFDTNLRNMLLDWMGIGEEQIILVVDEAHNLPDYLRDLLSAQLSTYMLNSCLYETERFGDPLLLNKNLTISRFVKDLNNIIFELRQRFLLGGNNKLKYVEKKDALLPPNAVVSQLTKKHSLDSEDMERIISALIAYGEQIQTAKQKQGKLPRSYIHKLGVFLSFWMNIDDEHYIKLIVDETDGKNPRIEAYCLDPSLGANIVHRFLTSIHMSGTLSPLDEYRDSIGLPAHTMLYSYPSPFPRENRRILYVNDVTTRYDEIKNYKGMMKKIQQHITDICNATTKNTIVFFPSFDLMNICIRDGLIKKIKRPTYIEEQRMSQHDLMEVIRRFKEKEDEKNNGSVLFSVIGGRISEGMDFPADELEVAVIVGIPYPKPTARQKGLQRYYQKKFGKGWEYTVNAPTARKLLQAIGRLIRNETDKGIAILLDKRTPRFRRYISDVQATNDVLQELQNFISVEDQVYHQ
ncbi:MAG TPA: ATP-dependent DNA helicase [Thermoplasmatales archaeon]|nr:ATP-dependent DNA helicase [Thermoplasmatales archaeon]